jgi:hypothetical protein
MSRAAAVLAGLALAAGVGGCAPYALRGKVIEGEGSYVTLVDASDPRLDQPGISGAGLTLVLDPTHLRRRTIAQGVSGDNGEVKLPVDEFGAGTLELDVALFVRKTGREPAEGIFRLPGSNRRVLVSLARGQDRDIVPPDRNLRGDVDRFWDGRR